MGRRVKGDEIPPLNMFINNFPPARFHDRPVSRCLLDKRSVKDHTRLLVKFSPPFLLFRGLCENLPGEFAFFRASQTAGDISLFLFFLYLFFLLMLRREIERFYADGFGK